MESILNIADSFYELNDIQINKDKSDLLLRRKLTPVSIVSKTGKVRQYHQDPYGSEGSISLNFDQYQLNISPHKFNNSIRILGCYFNANNNSSFIIHKI